MQEAKGMKDSEIVKVVIDKKVWEVTRKMANGIISMAKKKYSEENVNAVVAVEKGNIISLQKDVFDKTDAFVKAVANWERGGYKCYYTTKKG